LVEADTPAAEGFAMSTEKLWAPWRMAYIRGLAGEQTPADDGTERCFLCEASQCTADTSAAWEKAGILANDARGVLMLNRYPYTNGHLFVVPHSHVGSLQDLTADARAGLMEMVTLAERLVRKAAGAQGVNVGINLGRCAGAGVPGHLHVHVVPRWNGDTNFMDVVGGVRVIPESLEASYEAMRRAMAAE